MPMVGNPNRFAAAGGLKIGLRPRAATVKEPSAFVVILADADAFSVTALPVLRFVYDCLNLPVNSWVMDPSAVLRILMNCLLSAGLTRTLNPQNPAGRVKVGDEKTCHLGPRPARAGEAVSTPANMPSSALSATITPARLMTIPPNSARRTR